MFIEMPVRAVMTDGTVHQLEGFDVATATAFEQAFDRSCFALTDWPPRVEYVAWAAHHQLTRDGVPVGELDAFITGLADIGNDTTATPDPEGKETAPPAAT